MRLPTFIIVGVQKAGTTSIYDYLQQHPQVYMSPVKEPNFLERDWPRLLAEGAIASRPNRIDTFEKYAALFEGVTDEIAIGEASVNCLFHYDQSIHLIKKYVPDVQIIVVLRHPAERAYSDYLMHIRDCVPGEGQQSLGEIIATRAQTAYMIRKGFYTEGIQAFQAAFGADRVKVMLHDDLKASAADFMRDFYGFIGVDDHFETDVSRRAQTAEVPKNKSVNALLRSQNPFRTAVASTLRLFVPPEVRQQLRDRLIRLNSAQTSTDPFLPEDRAHLIALYRDDVLKLQDLLQRDLSTWLA
jgi:hypothetical protein